jgi:Ni,Fe-hydrogenase III small subunit
MEPRPLSSQTRTWRSAPPKKTLLAYGTWNRQGSEYKPVYTAGPTTRVANVAVEAIGDATQAAEILAGLNSAAITGLITR